MTSKRSFWSLLMSIIVPLLLLVFPAHIGTAAKRANTRAVDEVKQRSAATYAKLPLSFEINQGQTDPRVKFLSRGGGYTLFLTGNEAVLSLQKKATGAAPPFRAVGAGLKPGATTSVDKPTTDNGARTTNAVLRTRLVGANVKAEVTGAEELPGKSNYFIGNDPQKWRTNVPNYAKVRYQGVYPGVDLVYYGNQGGQLEYDFVVAPGADPSVVTLEVGADSVRPAKGERRSPLQIAADGDVVVKTEGGEVRFRKPVVYQAAINNGQRTTDNAERTVVEGHYVLTASNQVRLALGPYDHTKPLVIDPVLTYATFLGGSALDQGFAIAVDGSGNAYITGVTNSTNFPTQAPLQSTKNGNNEDVFVSKFDPSGAALLYSTYLGGTDFDFSSGIAVDTLGDAFVLGYTASADFPTTPGAFQTTTTAGGSCFDYAGFGGPSCHDAFVAKLNPAGSALAYSTYIGGSGDELTFPNFVGGGIALDSAGNAYVTGQTNSADFPVTPGVFQMTYSGGTCAIGPNTFPCYDVFVAKVNASGTSLAYATYLGGTGEDEGIGIALDTSGDAYVTGDTLSTNFPTTGGAYQTACNGCGSGNSVAFVTKLNPTATGLDYSTYLGGTGGDTGVGIAVDSAGNALVSGETSSVDFPTTVGAFQTTYGGGYADVFVAKLNSAGSGLLYSTYLGGSGGEDNGRIAIDASGNAYVTGATTSTDFPLAAPIQSSCRSCPTSRDVFVSMLNASGSALVFSTYLGGTGDEEGEGIALDASSNVYVVGKTESADFPITPGAFQTTCASCGIGRRDVFVAKILTSLGVSATTLTFPLTDVGSTTSSQTLTLTNTGTEPMSVNITTTPGFSETNNCPSTLAVGQSCTIWITSTPTGGGTQAGQLIISGPPGGPAVVPLTVQGILPGNIATLAGGGPNSTVATSAVVIQPSSVAMDAFGNVFIVSPFLSQVFKADPAGNFTVVAGIGTAGFGGDNGAATSASLSWPSGVALDTAGDLFIADNGNLRIRRVDHTTGIITTVAGSGANGYGGDNGPATGASFASPYSVAVDGSGNLYIGDTNNHVVRRVVLSTGIITTVAGNHTATFSGDGVPATTTSLNSPYGVAVDTSGNLFIADSHNSRIRVVNTQGSQITVAGVPILPGDIATVAGNGTFGFGGDGVPATSTSLNNPYGVAVDGSENLFIADTDNSRIRRVYASSGIITTVAGNGTFGFSGDGGAATSASLNYPYGVAVDASDNLLIADSYNNRIRRVGAATGTINTMAGGGSAGDAGPATSALLATPSDVGADSSGNLFIADRYSDLIRRVDAATGTISTVAGNGSWGFSGDGGPATSAMLDYPYGLAVEGSGNFFIADYQNSRIRGVASGTINTVAGNGTFGFGADGVPATSTSLNAPSGVALDSSANLFIADSWNYRVRRVDATTHYITTVAGNGTAGYAGDNGPATSAKLASPTRVAVDGSGNLFIADSNNFVVRRVDHTTGIITTFAGSGTSGFSGDGGPATSARLDYPYGLAVDGSGNLFIADVDNVRIRRVDASTGIITTVAGNGSWGFSGDGGPATSASLNYPWGVAVDSSGHLFIADTSNSRVREVLLAPVATLSTTSLSFSARLVGTTSAAQTVTVTNSGGANLTISSIAASGDYARTSTCPISPATLNPGSTCLISVSFTPTGVGTRAGTLTITDNSNGVAGSTQTVGLSGIGLTSLTGPAASVSPTSLSFASQVLGTTSAAQIVTLTSSGSTYLNISSIAITGTNASDFAETNNCPTSMAPGAYCTINVQFTPSQIGTRGGTLSITDNASDSPQLVPLSGTGITSGPTPPSPIAEPLIANGGTNPYQFTGQVPPFTPNAFNYKVTYPKLLNPPQSVNLVVQPFFILQADLDALLEGTGFEGAKIVPYDETGGAGVLFRATCQDSSGNPITCPQTTAPYTHYTSWNTPLGAPPISNPGFLWAPAGTHAWQNDFTGFSQTRIDPTGAGHTCCGLSDFVFVDLGASVGAAPSVTIVTPPNGAQYIVNQSVYANYSCAGTYVTACLGTVPSGSAIDTSSVGSKTFEVNAIVSSGPSADQTVTYQVVPGPLAGVSPSSIDFGTVYLGTITPKNVTVTNQGTVPMTITDPLLSILSGGDSKEFVALNLCPKSLAAGKSCTIVVIFVAGPFYTPQTATLKVMDNAPGSPQTVALTATVINPQAHLSASSLSFGTQKVNMGSTPKAVTLKNTGATALTITSIAIAGTDPLDFVQTNNCPSSLAANAACTINVTFKPTAKGWRSGSVVVTDNAQNSPQNIALSGTGK